jgi:peptidoglycan/LPS O-acetylase OafA/YrhL
MDDIISTRASDLRPPVPADAGNASAASASPAELATKTGMKPVGESSHELKALHGLRFLAAFCILFSHACAWLANFKDNDAIDRFGDSLTVYGMPLFFVLSGFVIHYNYSRLFSTMRPGWAVIEFMGARFARIYPLFICFFMVGLAVDEVLQWGYHHKLNLLLVFAHFLTLTQSWVYVVLYGDRLVLDGTFGLSWSLSTEFFFYVSYVVLVLHITRMRKLSSLVMTAAAMSVVMLAGFMYCAGHRAQITAFAGQYMNDHFEHWDHSAYRWFFYYSPYARVFEFILGCLTAQIYGLLAERPVSTNEARIGRYMLFASLAYLLAFAYLYMVEPFGPAVAEYVELLKLNFGCAVPIAVLIFCVSRYRSSEVAAILSAPLMVMLGDLSYSIYTVHTWTLRIFERPTMTFSLGVGLEAVFRIVVALLFTVIVSFATYTLIEVPARAWGRKLVARHLLRRYGPRDANRISKEQVYSARREIVVLAAFVAMLGAVVLYQFLIVPHFTPFTR